MFGHVEKETFTIQAGKFSREREEREREGERERERERERRENSVRNLMHVRDLLQGSKAHYPNIL